MQEETPALAVVADSNNWIPSTFLRTQLSDLIIFQLAEQAFKDALGNGIWLSFLEAKPQLVSKNQEAADTNTKASNSEGIQNPCHEAKSNNLKSAQYPIDATASVHLYKDFNLFVRLEGQGIPVEVPYNKVSTIFNLARLLEQLHSIETASILYRLILYKV